MHENQLTKISLLEKIKRIADLYEWKTAIDEIKKDHLLQYLFLEVTRKCNLNCIHCGSSCDWNTPYEELTLLQIEKIFREIAEDFPVGEFPLSVTGGEPLVREDIYDIIELLSGLGYYVQIVTNGTLLNERNIEKLKKADLKAISISLDGNESSHDYLRNKKGVYKEVKKNIIDAFSSNYFSIVEILSCVHNDNINDLNETYGFVTELGLDYWRILPVDPIGRAKDGRFSLQKDNLLRVLEFIKSIREKHPDCNYEFAEAGFLGLAFEGIVRPRLFACLAGISIGSILCDGSAAACPNLDKRFIQGNALERRFKDIWENEYKNMRDRKHLCNGMCKKCNWWDFCNGGSLHLYDLDKNEPEYCHYRILKS